ncbi:unnamed protein product, partial [Dovyalis caffra]
GLLFIITKKTLPTTINTLAPTSLSSMPHADWPTSSLAQAPFTPTFSHAKHTHSTPQTLIWPASPSRPHMPKAHYTHSNNPTHAELTTNSPDPLPHLNHRADQTLSLFAALTRANRRLATPHIHAVAPVSQPICRPSSPIPALTH